MKKTPDEEPIDPAAVAETEEYLAGLGAGGESDPGDWVGTRLAALRDEAQGKP